MATKLQLEIIYPLNNITYLEENDKVICRLKSDCKEMVLNNIVDVK